MTKTERRVPAKYAWLSLVMGMLAGGAAGMSEHGPGSVGRSFLDGQQRERQLQEQQKQANEQRQQQASQDYVRKAQTIENNLRMRQLAVSLSDHDFAHNQAVADSMKPFYTQFLNAGMIIPGTESGVSEEDLTKLYGAKVGDNNVIPVAVEYVRDPATGETVKDNQGVEKVRFKCAVADPSKKIDVTPEMQMRLQYWGLPGFVKQDGSPQVQGNMFVRGTIALGGITQAAQLDTAQKELSDYSQRTTGKPLVPNFLRDSIQKGLVSRNDILALEKVEGGHPVDEAITALIKDAPDSAAKVRALYNSISPLDKFAEERAIRLNSEKHPGSTPASTDDTNKFTGASLRADFPHLSAGQIRNFVARAQQKNVTGAQLEAIRKDAGEAEDRQIKLLQGNEDKGNATLDRSYQFNSTQLEKAAKPIEDAVARFGRLQDTINQATPQADALIAPELLTVMAGGQGSGLRMNEAEISRIVGGRSKYESLKAALNQWQLDPSKALSITPAQRGQIKALMSEVYGKLQKKQQILESARDQLIGGTTPTEHRQAVANLRKQLDGIDAGPVTQNHVVPAGKTPAYANGKLVG